jgi:putative FmdB family regulatory protein
MALYDLECSECGFKIETLTTYSKVAELQCLQCGKEGVMKITPSKSGGFKINGYSEANGYHRETIDYAKGPIG